MDQLIGLRLKGQTSGIILTIDSYEFVGTNTDINDLTAHIAPEVRKVIRTKKQIKTQNMTQ